MFEVTYQEVNKRDEVVTKRHSRFKTAAARDKFVEMSIPEGSTSFVFSLTLVNGGTQDVQENR